MEPTSRIPRRRGGSPAEQRTVTVEKRRLAGETALARLRERGPLTMRQLAEADQAVYAKLWRLGDVERNCRIHAVLEELLRQGLVRRKDLAWEAV